MMMIMALRVARWAAFGLIGMIALGIAALEFGAWPGAHRAPGAGGTSAASSADSVAVPPGVAIGGPFALTDDKGRAVTDAAYKGRWMLVFFGYSNCPDGCPLTLQKIAAALRALGPLADKVAPLFVTVDPDRDTPDRLAEYLANFDERIIGLTGSREQIAAVAKAYRVYYSPAEHEASGADLVNHSTFLYLMNPSGGLDALFHADVSPEALADALRGRLSAPSPAGPRMNRR
jgi:cytochrome oxidase Cu insertion factor (SCO1/SenC/PrrC family)